MKDYTNFREYFSSQLWAIRSDALAIMSEVLELRIKGTPLSADDIQARIGAARSSKSIPSGAIAVLPLYGVIDQKVSMMQQISGGTAVDEFMANFRAAMDDDSVVGILFDVDSPGGSISGVPEAANEILKARGKKPIIAIADPMIASAAYWISCAADSVYCMPSGSVGSIGVIAVHDDYSVMNEKVGYKPTYITYGQFKGEGNSDNPLTDDAKAYRQGQVDKMGDMFTRFVAKARGIPVDSVRKDFGQGRMLLAEDAKTIKMIDGIATIETIIASMAKTQASALSLRADQSEPDDDEDDDVPLCGCQCEANCECNGEGIRCCGDAAHECCAAKITAKDFSTMTVRDMTSEALVGLSAAVNGWGALVERQLARGEHPKILSKKKIESLQSLQASLHENSAKVDDFVSKTTQKAEEPVVESTAPSDFERSRLELMATLHKTLQETRK